MKKLTEGLNLNRLPKLFIPPINEASEIKKRLRETSKEEPTKPNSRQSIKKTLPKRSHKAKQYYKIKKHILCVFLLLIRYLLIPILFRLFESYFL